LAARRIVPGEGLSIPRGGGQRELTPLVGPLREADPPRRGVGGLVDLDRPLVPQSVGLPPILPDLLADKFPVVVDDHVEGRLAGASSLRPGLPRGRWSPARAGRRPDLRAPLQGCRPGLARCSHHLADRRGGARNRGRLVAGRCGEEEHRKVELPFAGLASSDSSTPRVSPSWKGRDRDARGVGPAAEEKLPVGDRLGCEPGLCFGAGVGDVEREIA
jgi:hypothetical protein